MYKTKTKLLLLAFVVFMSISVIPLVQGTLPATFGQSDLYFGVGSGSYQAHGFYYRGLHWAFYANSSGGWYHTSATGQNGAWSTATQIFNGYLEGYLMNMRFNSTHLYVVLGCPPGHIRAIKFRLGDPLANSSITWATAWQDVASMANHWFHDPHVNFDTTGRPWIGYDNVTTGDLGLPFIITSTLTNGTWNTSSGFPLQLDTTNSNGTTIWRAVPIEQPNDNMYIFKQCFIAHANWAGRRWNGTSGSWIDASWSNITQRTPDHGAFTAIESENDGAMEGDIFLAYSTQQGSYPYTADDLYFTKYDYSSNSWSTTDILVSEDSWDVHLLLDRNRKRLYLVYRGLYGTDQFTVFNYTRYDYRLDNWGDETFWFNASTPEMTIGEHIGISAYDQIWGDYLVIMYSVGLKAGANFQVGLNMISVWEPTFIYNFVGLKDESTDEYISGGVNATVYSPGALPDTFLVNGDTEREYYFQPTYASFDLPTNPDREYWFSTGENNTNVYIYTDTGLTAYVITFIDFNNILSDYSYVEARVDVRGTSRTIERRTADVEDKVTFSLLEGRKYSIQIENGVSLDYGELLVTSDTTLELSITGLKFPDTIIEGYRYVRIWGYRVNGTICRVDYQDLQSQTNNVTIDYYFQSNDSIAYQTSSTSDIFISTWSGANNLTDYYMVVTAERTSGNMGYRQILPRSFSTNPWSLDFLGNLPFETNILIPALLLLGCAGVFSRLSIRLGGIAFISTAILTTYIWNLPIKGEALAVGVVLVILIGLTYVRERTV